MADLGRLLPVKIRIPSTLDRPLLGESGHWDASSKSHVYDIRERLLSATSGRSWIRRQWSDDVSLNDRYRLQAAIRQSDVRPSTIDPKRTFPDCLKRDPDHLIPNQSVAGLTVRFTLSRISELASVPNAPSAVPKMCLKEYHYSPPGRRTKESSRWAPSL